MSQIKNPEPILITAGGKITCRRCKARSSRTKLQCSKPALKGKAVCGHHGGYSTGPKTKEGKERIRTAHWKDGNETIEAKAEFQKKNIELHQLEDIMRHMGLIAVEKKGGRKPKGYKKLDLNDSPQMTEAIKSAKLV